VQPHWSRTDADLALSHHAILGKVRGKTSRPDTASRMATDADFSHSRTTLGVLPSRGRDDRRLVKRAGLLADVDPLEELRHVYVRAGCSGIRQHVTLKTLPAVRGYSVCQMHGARDGALAGNRSAFKHGDFTTEGARPEEPDSASSLAWPARR
jgi:hypothetical protein